MVILGVNLGAIMCAQELANTALGLAVSTMKLDGEPVTAAHHALDVLMTYAEGSHSLDTFDVSCLRRMLWACANIKVQRSHLCSDLPFWLTSPTNDLSFYLSCCCAAAACS